MPFRPAPAPRRRSLALALFIAVGVSSIAGTTPAGAAQSAGEPAAGAEREVTWPGRTGLPVPRFVSLRAAEVNLRAGPGVRYPIEWVYRRRDLPVEVIAEFDTWRRIRDHDGTLGWVHKSMLQGRRTVRVIAEPEALLLDQPDADGRPVARLRNGAIGRLDTCHQDWCAVSFAGFRGWLRAQAVFGVTLDESRR